MRATKRGEAAWVRRSLDNWRRDYAEPTGSTPAFLIPLALVGGNLGAIGIGPGACTAFTAAAWLGALVCPGRRWRNALLCLALGSLLPGMALQQGIAARFDAMRVDAVLSGRIVRALPAAAPRSIVLDVADYHGPPPRPRRVRLTLHVPLDIAAGEHWELDVRLRAPRGLANPGGGDPERNMFRSGIDAVGYVRPETARRLRAARGLPGPRRLQQELSRRIEDAAPGPGGRHLRALLTGDREALLGPDWALLAATGTTHLLVVSGLHVGMVAGLVLLLCAVAGLRSSRPALTAALVLAAAGGYALLTGFELPARRALIMLTVGMLLLSAQRHGQPWAGLLWAALLIMLVDPLAPLAAGFWLSFLAVAGLLLVLGGRSRRQLSWLRGTLLAQLTITTLLCVPLALAFGRIPMAAPLVNVVAIPLVAMLLLPAGLLLLLGMVAGVPGADHGLGWLAQGLEGALALLAAMPDTALALTPAAGLLLPFAVLGAALVWVPWPWPLRLLGAALLAGSLVPQTRVPEPGAFRLHVLDVGQGLAAVVRTREYTLLYDTGPPFGEDSDAGQRVVVPALRALGVRRLDRILISHDHADHSGGLASVRRAFPEVSVRGPTPLPDDSGRCHAGQRWTWDGVSFEILLPEPGVAGDPRHLNRHSCVLRVRSADRALLLPGDVDVFAERRLAAEIGRKDVVIAPHHGSATSSGRVLVRLTQPRFVLVPAGHPSPFGHPHPDVLARWQAAGARVLGTGPGGMLTWDSGQPEQVLRERDRRRRYWNWRAPAAGEAYGNRH